MAVTRDGWKCKMRMVNAAGRTIFEHVDKSWQKFSSGRN